jgi:hypothetical protein
MNYAIETGLGGMLYVRSFIKIGTGIHTLKPRLSQKPAFVFQNKESRLKMET